MASLRALNTYMLYLEWLEDMNLVGDHIVQNVQNQSFTWRMQFERLLATSSLLEWQYAGGTTYDQSDAHMHTYACMCTCTLQKDFGGTSCRSHNIFAHNSKISLGDLADFREVIEIILSHILPNLIPNLSVQLFVYNLDLRTTLP